MKTRKPAAVSTHEHADVAAIIVDSLEPQVRRIVDATEPDAAWAWRDPNTLLWRADKTATAWVRTLIRRGIDAYASTLPAGGARARLDRVGFSDAVEKILAHEISALSSWADEWDRDDYVIQTPEGVFDLAAGNLRGTRLEDQNLLCTRVTPEDVPTPYTDAKLLEMMHGEPGMRDYLMDALALGLIGEPAEAAFFMLIGGSGTGKSVLVRLMLWMLGSYATSIDPRVFAATKSRFEEYQKAWLPQVRFLGCSEPDDGAVFNEAVVKKITGADEDQARQIRGTPLKYQPKCTIFMALNELPKLTRGGSPMARRLRPIRMDAPPVVEDRMMLDKLKAEAAGLLWKLALRAGEYLRTRTLPVPAGVMDLSRAYASSASAVEPWVEAELEVTGRREDFLSTGDAFKRFRTWCAANDYEAGELSLPGFSMRVQHALNRRLAGGYGATARVMLAGTRRNGFPKVVLKPETINAPSSEGSDVDPFS